MENRPTDYRNLYEEALLTLSEKEEKLIEKELKIKDNEHVIADLLFEMDKLKKYIFGFKSEKHISNVGVNQMGLFELGTTQALQEELSESLPV